MVTMYACNAGVCWLPITPQVPVGFLGGHVDQQLLCAYMCARVTVWREGGTTRAIRHVHVCVFITEIARQVEGGCCLRVHAHACTCQSASSQRLQDRWRGEDGVHASV